MFSIVLILQNCAIPDKVDAKFFVVAMIHCRYLTFLYYSLCTVLLFGCGYNANINNKNGKSMYIQIHCTIIVKTL